MTEKELATALRTVLTQIPIIEIETIETEQDVRQTAARRTYNPDIVAHIRVDGQPMELVCEVKSPGHPRQIRDAVTYLRQYLAEEEGLRIGVVCAPYLSPESQEICREQGLGYLDLAGNYQFVGDRFFIERANAEKPKVAKRAFKALFMPKSAQVLRTLLSKPDEAWRVTDLAEQSHVSLGHVSNVRSALLDREWASVDDEGLRLTAIDALLDGWRQEYRRPKGEQQSYYTPLHGKELEGQLRAVLAQRDDILLGSFSAAQWIAAYGRVSMTFLYAGRNALPVIIKTLDLTPSPKGANVEIFIPDDPDFFLDRFEPSSGIATTSPVQTYLDLFRAGDRGQEAAEHLRAEMSAWR